MGGSIKIGNVFGIPVRLHWMFLLLVYAYAILDDAPLMVTLMWIVALFGAVFLHELGHSLVARHFGIRVLDITLWPLGGMARLSEMPENSRVEGLVAIAGPAVNFVLALVALLVIPVTSVLGLPNGTWAAQIFVGINLVMGVFNLIPAFPLDGGRILRAWFARSSDWLSATERAVRVGRFFAGVMFFASIGLMITGRSPSCALPLIAIFVWFAGARELIGVRLRHGQDLFGAAGAGSGAPFGQGPFGQGDPSAQGGPGEAQPGSARRPSIETDPLPQGGFDERFIRRLENFRGRLRD